MKHSTSNPRLRIRRLVALFALIACTSMAPQSVHAQAPAPAAPANAAPGEKVPDYTVKLQKYGWTVEKDLVLALNVASVGKVLQLGEVSGQGKSEKIDIFSLAAGHMVDAYTGKKLLPLSKLPRKPFFGTMACIYTLERGDTMVMGMAFPKPAIPPLGPDGKQLPYKFTYYHPKLQPVEITFPCENNNPTSPVPTASAAPAPATR